MVSLILAKALSGRAQISQSELLAQAAALRNTRKGSDEVAETIKNCKNWVIKQYQRFRRDNPCKPHPVLVIKLKTGGTSPAVD